jgi:hypothetical protein
MGKLKPIGSEKLEGASKLARIMEIARYKEALPTQEKSLQTESFSVQLADGNTYRIVHEKNGYVIQKTVNESFDYVEPMKNRKYYSSYSEVFKRVNLIAKELNTLHENKDGVSLFGEQKKFVLKTPTPAPSPEPMPEPAIAPEAPVDAAPAEPSLDIEAPMPTDSTEPTDMAPDGGMPEGGEVSFKQVQKLTGKLAQKLREFKVSGELSSKDMKYVINSILSALDLVSLEEGDREEILSRFETDEIDTDMESDMEITSPEIETPEEEMPVGEGWADENYEIPEEEENPESRFTKEIMDSIFAESKIEKTLTKYFERTKTEVLSEQKKVINKKQLLENKIRFELKEIKVLAENSEQEKNSRDFLRKNPTFKFIGKTNKKSLVFEGNDKQVKITKEGDVL